MALNTLHDDGGGELEVISTTRAKLSLAERGRSQGSQIDEIGECPRIQGLNVGESSQRGLGRVIFEERTEMI